MDVAIPLRDELANQFPANISDPAGHQNWIVAHKKAFAGWK
jgi:hypothetical protein